jgi:ribosomal protein S18 acetylase RimI-like enzyme
MDDLLAQVDRALSGRKGLAVRPAAGDDEVFLRSLFAEDRGALFAVLPAEMARQMLAMQFRARALDYDRRWPDRAQGLVAAAGAPVGRIELAWNGPPAGGDTDGPATGGTSVGQSGDLHLIDLALICAVRNHGIGTALIEAVIEAATAAGARRLRLSVMSGNAGALRLYRRLGFAAMPAPEPAVSLAMSLDLA